MLWRPLWVCFVFTQVLVLIAAPLHGDDWPHWRGPALNGISKERGWSTSWPAEGPKQLWKASVGTGFSSFAVASGRVFTLGNQKETDTVYCFDAENGNLIWKHSYACPLDPIYYEGGPGSTPSVDGERVYTLSKRAQLFCFEAATGKVLWERDLTKETGAQKPRWGFAGSPLVDGDRLLVNVGSAGTALDKTSGRLLWKSETNAPGYATPVPFESSGEKGVILFSGKSVLAVREKDGKQLWEFPWIERWELNAADPLRIGADKLFVSSFGHGCALLRIGSGQPTVLWQNQALAHHFNCGVYLDGFIYGINGNTDQPEKDLRCVEVNSGRVKWTHTGVGLGSITAADGKLMVLSDHGELMVAPASPEAFKPIARAQALGGKCWTVPVLANGRIYCRNAEGTVVCLDVRAH